MTNHNINSLLEGIRELPFDWAFTACNDKKAAIYQDWRNIPLGVDEFEAAIAAGYFAQCHVKRRNPKPGQEATFQLPADWVVSVGCMCGEPSGGLVFVDHDGKTVDRWLETELNMTPKQAFPKSPTVSSGRDGRYTIVYRVPFDQWDAVATRKIKTGDSGTDTEDEMLELRWTGLQSHVLGYHPTTGGYHWVHHPKETDIVDAPQWILQLMKEAGDRRKLYEESSRQLVSKHSGPKHFVVPLEVCLAKVTRRALQGDFAEGRNDTGSKIVARDLIGTANYLNLIGQAFEGDPEKMFMDWCQMVGLFEDDPPNQPQIIWENAIRSNPTPSLSPEMLDGCIKGFEIRENRSDYVDAAVNKAKVKRAYQLTALNREAIAEVAICKDVDEVFGPGSLEESVEVRPEEIEFSREEILAIAIRAYIDCSDPLQRVLMENELALKYKLSGRRLLGLVEDFDSERDIAIHSMGEMVGIMFDEVERRNRTKIIPGLKCGFYDLDGVTGGFQDGDLIILAARPSMGKTAIALDMAHRIAETTGQQVLFFTLEMSNLQLTYRVFSSFSRIPGKALRGLLTDDQLGRFSAAVGRVSEWPIFLSHKMNLTPMNIRTALSRHCEENGKPGIIMIDYLQLMSADGSIDGFNRNLEVSLITRGLKAIAQDYELPVMVLSQLSRGVESRNDKRPMMSDLRDSGSIEQDADLIMMMYRDEYYHADSADAGLAEVIIAKHRNGPVGTVKLLFEKNVPRFENRARSLG